MAARHSFWTASKFAFLLELAEVCQVNGSRSRELGESPLDGFGRLFKSSLAAKGACEEPKPRATVSGSSS